MIGLLRLTRFICTDDSLWSRSNYRDDDHGLIAPATMYVGFANSDHNSEGCTEQAIEVYRTLLDEHDPEHSEAIHALQRVYANLERWPELFAELPGLREDRLRELGKPFTSHDLFAEPNLFFGGVHAVARETDGPSSSRSQE